MHIHINFINPKGEKTVVKGKVNPMDHDYIVTMMKRVKNNLMPEEVEPTHIKPKKGKK